MSASRMDVMMWREALTGIPRVDQSRWARLALFGRWLIAIRAAVLVMTLLATIVDQGEVTIPSGGDQVQAGATVVVLTTSAARPSVERLFQKRIL